MSGNYDVRPHFIFDFIYSPLHIKLTVYLLTMMFQIIFFYIQHQINKMQLSAKLTSLVISTAICPPRSIDILRKELSNTSTQLRAMRTIVSMIQLNYDTSQLTTDIIKLIDTNNYELKALCNFYLRNTCTNRPACQLMCTHTFFKDFNDRNHKIQQLALIDSMHLSDEVLVEHYVKDIKRMVHHPRQEIRMLTARSISILYIKNRDLFYKKNMKACLAELLSDSCDQVVISALKAVGTIEAAEPIIASEDIVTLAIKFYEKGESTGLRYALNILKYKQMNDPIRKLISNTFMSNDIAVFYLSAKMLLDDGFCRQKVYEMAIGFMNTRPEQLCNLLLFIHSFIDQVNCDINDFLIRSFKCCDDPLKFCNYELLSSNSYHHVDIIHKINIVKIMIIGKKYNTLAEKEQRLIEDNLIKIVEHVSCLRDKIFEILLTNKAYIPAVIDRITPSDRVLWYIQNNKSLIAPVWTNAVSDLLMRVKDTELPVLYMDLVGCLCKELPRLVFRFGDEKHASDLIRMFVAMMRREIITVTQCRTYLNNIKKRHTMLRRIDLVLEHLDTVDPNDIVCGTSQMREEENDWLEIDSKHIAIKGDVVFENPENTDELLIEKDKELTYDNLAEKHTEIPEVDVKITQLPFFIDFRNLKGILDADKNKFILIVDILEGEEIIKYTVGPNPVLKHEDQIAIEGRYSMFEITRDFFNKAYTVELCNHRFSGVLNLQSLTKPQSCTFREFEDEFEKAKGSAVLEIEAFNELQVYKVDFQRYCGNILGHRVYFKNTNEKYDVRGDEYIIEIIQQ